MVRAWGDRRLLRGGAPTWTSGLPALIATLLAGVIVTLALEGASSDALRVSGVFAALGALVVVQRADRWAIGLVVLVAAWWISVLAVRYLPDVINPAPPVNQAVGAAAFFDTPYRGAQIAAVLTLALAVVVALVATVASTRGWGWRRQARVAPGEPVAQGTPQAPARSSRVMWIGVAVLAFTLIPDLRAWLNEAGEPISYTWDYSNLTSWQLLVAQGLQPMKDFFYPYGFQWLFNLGNTGPVYQWLSELAMLALAGWSLWRLSARRTWAVLACLVLMVLLGLGGFEAWRFIPSMLVAVTYAAVGPLRHSRVTRGHLVFFGACLLALAMGADVFGNGLAGAGLVLIGDVVGERVRWRPRRLLVGLGVDLVPVLGAIVLQVLVWVASGTAANNIRFLGGFTAVSAASALDEKVFGPLGMMVLHPNAYSLEAVVPTLLAAAGLLWARLNRGEAQNVAAILLAGAGVSFLMVLKQFVRPIGDEVLIAPLLALGWSVILAWRPSSVVRAAACGAALAALLLVFNMDRANSFSQYVKSVVDSPAHAVRSVLVAFEPGRRARAARASMDPGRFKGWPDTQIAVDFLEAVNAPPVPSFAIVGDSQMTYVLLHQPPPFFSELYDASPIDEQEHMISILEQRRPQYVIWRKDYFTDAVLYNVRNPLVFRWMIENYVPVRQFATVDILRRRRPGEPVPASFWTSQLGGSENLEYIPSFSQAASASTCSAGPDCVEYALVSGRARRALAGAGFVVSGNGHEFGVTLSLRSGVEDYPVRLDRLWFSPLVGPRPTLTSLTSGFTVRLVGLSTGGNLY